MSSASAFQRSSKGDYLLKGTKDEYSITQANFSNPIQKSASQVIYQSKSSKNEEVIIKQIKNSAANIGIKESEIQMMEEIKENSNSNVECIYDYAVDKINYYFVVRTPTTGNLSQMIIRGVMKEQLQILEYARQLSRGLQTLHKYNVIHRDISCDNVFVAPINIPTYRYQHYLTIGDALALKSTPQVEHSVNFETQSSYAPELQTCLEHRQMFTP
jgi:serine/threonine protein kinase